MLLDHCKDKMGIVQNFNDNIPKVVSSPKSRKSFGSPRNKSNHGISK